MRPALAAPLLALLLAACSNVPPRAALEGPQLRLLPGSAGIDGAWQQRFEFAGAQRTLTFDALLEIDGDTVQLAALSLQQVAYTLRWDGRALTETRAEWLPDGLRGAWVLDDLQLAWWPVDAIRAALPTGWTLDASDGTRVLRHRGVAIATVRHPTPQQFELEHHARGYRLRVDSVAADGAPDD